MVSIPRQVALGTAARAWKRQRPTVLGRVGHTTLRRDPSNILH